MGWTQQSSTEQKAIYAGGNNTYLIEGDGVTGVIHQKHPKQDIEMEFSKDIEEPLEMDPEQIKTAILSENETGQATFDHFEVGE